MFAIIDFAIAAIFGNARKSWIWAVIVCLNLLAVRGASVAACLVAVIASFSGIDLAVAARIFGVFRIARIRGIARA